MIYDLLLILAAGLAAGLVCRQLRVSPLVGYLAVGVVIGKSVLGLVHEEHEEIEKLAEAGVFLLLFSIGLEFSLEDIARLGRHFLVGGAVQMLLAAVPVAAVLLWLQATASWQAAVLLGLAAAFSSTVMVFKLLAELGQSSTRHGRRAIGVLLFQDAALVPLLLAVPLLTGQGETPGLLDYLLLAGKSLVFVASIVLGRVLFGRHVIPLFARYRSPDLVVLLALVVLGAVAAAAHAVGLPPAVGALAAGLLFGGNRWTGQTDALVLPFRETFAVVFFVSLGLLLDIQVALAQPLLMLVCLAGLVLLKAAAAAVALRLTQLDTRTSLGMGIGLAHLGEFAFVVVHMAWEAGLIQTLNYQRVVTLALGSLMLSPLLLRWGCGGPTRKRSPIPLTPPPARRNAPAALRS